MLSQSIAVNFTNKGENRTAYFSHVAILPLAPCCKGHDTLRQMQIKIKIPYSFLYFQIIVTLFT